jgi:hypothetical protein
MTSKLQKKKKLSSRDSQGHHMGLTGEELRAGGSNSQPSAGDGGEGTEDADMALGQEVSKDNFTFLDPLLILHRARIFNQTASHRLRMPWTR